MRLTILLVALIAASLSFGLVEYTPNLPEKQVIYPEPKVVEELPVDVDFIRAKVDPIGGNISMLIPKPIQTGVRSVNSPEDAKRAAIEFAKEFKSLIGISANNLIPERAEKFKGTWYVTLAQAYDGIKAIGNNLELRIDENGKVFLVHSDIKPIEKPTGGFSLTSQQAINRAINFLGVTQYEIRECRKAVGILCDGKKYSGRYIWWLTIKIENPVALYWVWVDAQTGEILRAENQLPTVSGRITGQYLPEHRDDSVHVAGFPYEYIVVDGRVGYSDSSGYYTVGSSSSGSHTFFTALRGRYCIVSDDAHTVRSIDTTIIGASFDVCWTAPPMYIEQVNLYYHVNRIHDYYKYFLGYNGMDYRVSAEANDSRVTDNAYSDGMGIHFGREGSSLYNLALFADVIYHEYTHLVTARVYPAGTLPYSGQGGAINEGRSDYFPCSFLNDSRMGDRAFKASPTAAMRNLNNSKRYPTDMVGEPHRDSQIISGAWWDIRRVLGAGYTDTLVHLAALLGHANTFERYLNEMLVIDDDDHDLTNGTPHAAQIYTGYHNHGIGPSEILSIDHIPLGDREDTVGTYEVRVRIFTVVGLDSTAICYRVNWSPWHCDTLRRSGSEWVGEIPAQRFGSIVHYYLYARAPSGYNVYSPVGAPANFYVFRVARDTIAPQINHTPITRASVAAWSPLVAARVTDNGSLREVVLEYRYNGVTQPQVTFIYNDSLDIWTARFGSIPRIGDTIEYRIRAVDNSSASNTAYSPSATSWYSFVVQRDYLEDFETGALDYRHYSIRSGYLDEWHIEDSRAHSDSLSYKCGGTGRRDYSDRVDAALETPYIYVSGDDTLSFYHWMDAELDSRHSGYAWDGGIVEMSTDGGVTWRQITPIGGYPYRIQNNPVSPFRYNTPCFSTMTGWQRARFALSFTGWVKFRFHFGSDGYVTGEGWYIDDVRTTNYHWTAVLENGKWVPEKLGLSISPNPFNSALKLMIAVPENGKLTVDVVDINGRLVSNIHNAFVEKGFVNLVWRPETLPTGIYFVVARTNSSSAVKKVAFIK